MRILHTIDTGGIYGKERMLLALVKAQIKEGHTVHVVGFGNNDFFDEMTRLCHTYRLTKISQLWNAANTWYDVIHAHDYKTGIILAAWHILDNQRVVVRTVHGYSGHIKPWTKLSAYEKLDRFMLRFIDGVVAVSDQLGDELGADVIYNGIDKISQYDQPKHLREDILEFCDKGVDNYPEPYVFCCMARLAPEKNLANLIRAIRDIPRAKLLLFGDGPQRAELEKLVEWCPEKVMFAGFDKDARYYLNWVHAYVQPSITEGLPISVLEALSLGVPMLTSYVGGMRLLHDAGVVTDSSQSQGTMTLMMQEFMKESEDKRRRANSKGITLFDRMFSSSAMYDKYHQFYQQVT